VSFRQLIDDYKTRHRTEDSLEDQVAVLAAHNWIGTNPDDPHLKKSDIEETLDEMGVNLDCNLGTSVGNTDEDQVISSFRPDDLPDWFIIRERDGAFVMGDDEFPAAVHDECERVISHIEAMSDSTGGDDAAVADGGPPPTNDDGQTLREVIAEEIEEDSNALEDYLRRGPAKERRSKLNDVVEVIKQSGFEKPDSYDEISLVPKARRYHLSQGAISEYDLA